MFRKLALPFGLAFFLAGLFFAGIPYKLHIEWGTSLGLTGETLLMTGFAAFFFGAVFMWIGRGGWIKRTVRAELTHIMILLQHLKGDKSHVNIGLHGRSKITEAVEPPKEEPKVEKKPDVKVDVKVEVAVPAATEAAAEEPLISTENKE